MKHMERQHDRWIILLACFPLAVSSTLMMACPYAVVVSRIAGGSSVCDHLVNALKEQT